MVVATDQITEEAPKDESSNPNEEVSSESIDDLIDEVAAGAPPEPVYHYYPVELRGDGWTDWPGTIEFRCRQLPQNNISNSIKALVDAAKESIDEITETFKEQQDVADDVVGIDSEDRSKASTAQKTGSAVLAGASTVGNVIISGAEAVGEALAETTNAALNPEGTGFESFENFIGPDAGIVLGSVYLPLVKGLRFDDQTQYNNAELGFIGGAAEAGINAGTGAMNSLGQAIGNEIRGLVNGTGQAPSVAVLRAIKEIPFVGLDAAAGARSAARVTTNPNLRTLFDRVGIRNFAFNFNLIAQSADEAEEIKKIVKFFRENMYPETIESGGLPVGYVFPNIFDIRIRYKTQDVATKILPVYLRDMQVSYNTSGLGMHADGNFFDVGVSMSFTEAYTLDRNKIRAGY
jgi:hypothetical protein